MITARAQFAPNGRSSDRHWHHEHLESSASFLRKRESSVFEVGG